MNYFLQGGVTDTIGAYVGIAVVGAIDLVTRYPEVILITAVIAAMTLAGLAIAMVISWSLHTKPRNEDAEMRRRLQLDSMYADRFGDALFDMLMANDIDRHEYKRACRRFGIAYRLSDLLTRKNSKRGLKYRVAHNCEVMHKQIFKTQPRIPGPKPGEDVPVSKPVVKPKRKVWLVVGKAALSRKTVS